VFTKTSGALEGYKEKIGKRKFATKIKKASKLFAADLTKALRKNVKTLKNRKPPIRSKQADSFIL